MFVDKKTQTYQNVSFSQLDLELVQSQSKISASHFVATRLR